MTQPLVTTRRLLAQIAFCKGCCCGRTDRGLPEVPVERLKAAWKAEKLNRSVQLTISGCLGPCDLPNVALILTPMANVWLGRLAGDTLYDSLLAWALTCHREGKLVPLPEDLAAHQFDRFGLEGEER